MRLTATVTDAAGNTATGTADVEVASGQTYTPPASINATGETDVAAELTAWLDGLPDGATADLGVGIFRCQTKIRLYNKTGLTIRGGTIIREGEPVYTPTLNFPEPLLWLLDATNCAVEDTTFRDTNTVADQRAGFGAYVVDRELETAVRFDRYTDCRVTGIDVDGIWGDGVQWQVGDGAYMADCRIDRIGRQGVTTIGWGFLIERVRVEHGRRSGFDFEPDFTNQVTGGAEVRDCYTNTIGLSFASGGMGAVNDVWLHHNTSTGASVPVVYVKASDGSRRSGWTVEDHTALQGLGSPQSALFFVNVDNVTVRRCTLPVATSQSRLFLGLSGCGGTIEVTDNVGSPGGDRYYNRTPQPGQTITVSGNTPALTEVP